MSCAEPARTAARGTGSTILAALVVASAALIGVLIRQSLAASSFSGAPPIDLLHGDRVPVVTGLESGQPTPADHRRDDDHDRRRPAIPLGEEDGAVPDGVTVFDDEIPAVAKLDPALLGALRRAATEARGDGVKFYVDSGWRSPGTRNSYSVRRSRSTAQERKLPDGWPPPTRLRTCRGTRSTLGPPMRRRGCPSTAPSTGCARSTATSPGTTNCAPKPSLMVVLPCTPTLRTIQGRSSDQQARHRTGVNTIITGGETHEEKATAGGGPCNGRLSSACALRTHLGATRSREADLYREATVRLGVGTANTAIRFGVWHGRPVTCALSGPRLGK